MTLSIRVLKMDILKKKLEALPGELQAKIHDALQQSADEIVATAKTLVPVHHGVLRDSLGWVWGEANIKRKDGKKSSGYGLYGTISRGANQPKFVISIGADIGHLRQHKRAAQLPRWVEFGTQAQSPGEKVVNLDAKGRITRVRRSRVTSSYSGMPPRPFLYPAYRIHIKTVKARVNKAVRDALTAVAKKG